MTIRSHVFCRAFALFLASFITGATAAEDTSTTVLVKNALITLTRADYDAELSQIPPEMRAPFAMSPKRIEQVLNNLLVMKTLAEQARRAGLDKQPDHQARIRNAVDKVLAQIQVEAIEQQAATEFDRRIDEFTSRARETYLLNRAKYGSPELVSASHILFSTESRSEADALAAAKEARAKIAAGANFESLAKTLSDDPGSKANGGRLGMFAAEQMDPAFSRAAFALKTPGDISEPVVTRFGVHLIRLDGRQAAKQRSFDEAKNDIIAEIRAKYISDLRDARVNEIRGDKNLEPNQAAIDALVVKPPPIPPRPARGAR